MHGKAGCGKTVLFSTVAEDIRQHCQQSSDTVSALFYFSFSDNHKQSKKDLLRSLVVQLGWREPGFSLLRQAYQKRDRSIPGPDELEKILLASIKSCKTVFLLLDALDECSEENDDREGVLERIEMLTSNARNLNFFVTSRELPQIRDSLDELGFQRLPIAVSAVNADIQTYVTVHPPPIRLKERPVLDSISNGALCWLFWAFGYSFSAQRSLVSVSIPSARNGRFVFLLGSAMHSLAAAEDARADAIAGQRTIATVCGVRFAIGFAHLCL